MQTAENYKKEEKHKNTSSKSYCLQTTKKYDARHQFVYWVEHLLIDFLPKFILHF